MADPNYPHSYQPVSSDGNDMMTPFSVYGDANGNFFMASEGFGHFNSLPEGTINSAYPPLQTDVVQRGTKRRADDVEFEDNSLARELEPEHAVKPVRKSTKSRKTGKTSGAAMEANTVSLAQWDAAVASAQQAEHIGLSQGLYPPIKMNFGHTVPELQLEAEAADWSPNPSFSGFSTPEPIPLTVDISASSEWDLPNAGRMNSLLIYRRNYMTFKVSFTLFPQKPGSSVHVNVCFPNGKRHRVQGFGMLVDAVVADETLATVPLIQNTTKRDKGPTTSVTVGRVSPRNPEMQHDTGISPLMLASGQFFLPRNIEENDRVSPSSFTFTRVQFTKATQNNGRTNQPQQYFCIRPELWVDIGIGSAAPEWHRVAVAYSERMVVRGRSPGHYNAQDQKAMKLYIKRAKETGHVDRLVPPHLQNQAATQESLSDSPPPRGTRRKQLTGKRGVKKRSHSTMEPVDDEYETVVGTTIAEIEGLGQQYPQNPVNVDQFGNLHDPIDPAQMGGLITPGFTMHGVPFVPADDRFASGHHVSFGQDPNLRPWGMGRNILFEQSMILQAQPGQQDARHGCHGPGCAPHNDDLAGPSYEEGPFRRHDYGHHMG